MHKQNSEVTINPAMENTGSNAATSKQPPKRKLCFMTETGKDIQQSPEQKMEGVIEGVLTQGLNILAAPRKKENHGWHWTCHSVWQETRISWAGKQNMGRCFSSLWRTTGAG